MGLNLWNGSAATIRGLFNDLHRRIFGAMELEDGASLVADLTTIGRKSGLPRTVELRLLHFKGSFYVSSSRVEGKHWCQNMIKNPAVEISARGEKLSAVAKQVTDDALRRRILTLRDSPPRMDRVVFAITPRK
jgi:deazaflavin-dependent oxidoreductase (nitroreductase family)